ncbi:hypothetical protein ABID21_003682 [Pseudorhizobium tarimense]|uniref:Uncharacterized protein n=1 Tax=Pseudorhizobium tarimense TaxID=1079109 RepID=A0ABV2HAM6_9HYPH|nr:hypothetical protein [Pseudorhizobium tarimense]MCJ8521815.1 hypothetical protein [Pseudorhizobium tarimense]
MEQYLPSGEVGKVRVSRLIIGYRFSAHGRCLSRRDRRTGRSVARRHSGAFEIAQMTVDVKRTSAPQLLISGGVGKHMGTGDDG